MRCVVLIIDDAEIPARAPAAAQLHDLVAEHLEDLRGPYLREPCAVPPGNAASTGARGLPRAAAASVLQTAQALSRLPFIRWLTAPVMGVPAVYGTYSTMLHFWQDFGVLSSLWWHIFAIVAGAAGGVAAIAKLGVLPGVRAACPPA